MSSKAQSGFSVDPGEQLETFASGERWWVEMEERKGSKHWRWAAWLMVGLEILGRAGEVLGDGEERLLWKHREVSNRQPVHLS